ERRGITAQHRRQARAAAKHIADDRIVRAAHLAEQDRGIAFALRGLHHGGELVLAGDLAFHNGKASLRLQTLDIASHGQSRVSRVMYPCLSSRSIRAAGLCAGSPKPPPPGRSTQTVLPAGMACSPFARSGWPVPRPTRPGAPFSP